ncbi:MAG: DUF4159 domain-containing protein [Planctomycetes bacterium]|nr:DUF4159 domain-containing protein [Planctomycetota bacterium]
MRNHVWAYSIVFIIVIFILHAPEAGAQTGRQLSPLSAVENFTDEDVDKAIQRLIDYLFSLQLPEGNWPTGRSDTCCPNGWPTGTTAMSVYALIEAGVSAKDPRLVKALDWLVKNQDGDMATYSVGLRCNAWLAANKQTKKQYQKNLEKDVELLVLEGTTNGGGYSYFCPDRQRLTGKRDTGSYGDNSNSQYLLLGAWAGVRSGIEIPKEFWEICQKFWIVRQQPDGGWNYGAENSRSDPSYGSMSTAGLASLFVCIDATMGDRFIKCNVSIEFAPIKKALDWFDANFEKTLTAPWASHDATFFDYYMYGVERVGLASGYKYFGKYDWYKEGCKRLLALKESEPTAAGRIANPGYRLVFLARGRRPVLFNKLEYDGDWNNRPRALANFCRWAEAAYEREVNWQIVTLKSHVGDWHDAPVLAITGSKAPKFTDDDVAKLREYVNQGGTLLSITECGGGAFGAGMRNLYRKLFPKYELTNCGKDHPLYTAHYKMPGTPAVSIVSNGVRPLAIHTDADLPLSWQTYAVATAKGNFEAGANVLSYVTEKELYGRGTKSWPEEPSGSSRAIKAARIRYAGNYDPEPLALERLARLIGQTQKVKLDYTSVLSAATQSAGAPAATASGPPTGVLPTQLTGDVRLAFLTGTGAFKLPDDEKAALKKWVDAGGLLVMDAAGGNKAFGESARELAAELWGTDALLPMPLSSPVYQLKDMTIEKAKYRKTAKARIGSGSAEPRLLAVLAGDRPKVIVSPEDLTAGLVGYSSWGLDGYMPQSAFEIARNIVIYAAMAPPPPKEAASQPAAPPVLPAATTKPA